MQRSARLRRHARAARGVRPLRRAARRELATAVACLALGCLVAGFAQQAAAPDHFQRGEQLLRQGLWEPAIEAFSKALEIDPESARASFHLGLALRAAGRTDEGRAALADAVRRDPASERMRLHLGRALQSDGLWAESVAHFQEILKRNPASARARFGLGLALQERDDTRGALAQFRRAIDLDGKLVEARTALGVLLGNSGDLRAALAELRKALELQPEDLDVRARLGAALRALGENERAAEQFDIVLDRLHRADAPGAGRRQSRVPAITDVYGMRAQARVAFDLEGAVADYEEALARDPEPGALYYGLGQALKRLAGQARRARGHRPRVSAPATDRLLREARAVAARGDLRAARQTFERAVASAPRHAPAREALALLLDQQGDLDGAIRELTAAVDLDPQSAASRYYLGAALWYGGQPEPATAQLEQAVRLDPTHLAAGVFLFKVYDQLHRLDDARRFLVRTIALVGPQPQFDIDLGTVLLRMGRDADALGRFEAGLDSGTKPAATLELDIPIELLQSRLATRPADRRARDVLARMLERARGDRQ